MPRYSPVRFNEKYLSLLEYEGRRRTVFDGAESGLGLRIGRCSKTWVLVYRNGARVRFLKIGTYPAMSLDKARIAARAERVKVDEGHDPAAEKKAEKLAETFGELATEYLAKHAKKNKRSWQEDERILNVDLLPAWKDRKVREITRRDVRERIEAIAERAPVMANRVWALASTMFNFAIRRDWIDANPASLIERQPEKSRDRVLTHDETRALWATLEASKKILPVEPDIETQMVVSPMIARGLQVLLLTAQRPGEVFRMRWADLELPDDWKTNKAATAAWTIPEAVSKNRQAHRVPLTVQAVAILRECLAAAPDNNAHVFAGTKGASVSDRATKAAAVLSRKLGFEFHRHDLRRTAASEMAAAGIPRETIAKVLNHVDRGARMTQVYDRYSYDNEKRLALQTWARRLRAILEAKPDEVLPFVRPAG